jgi:hypothetical protein
MSVNMETVSKPGWFWEISGSSQVTGITLPVFHSFPDRFSSR